MSILLRYQSKKDTSPMPIHKVCTFLSGISTFFKKDSAEGDGTDIYDTKHKTRLGNALAMNEPLSKAYYPKEH